MRGKIGKSGKRNAKSKDNEFKHMQDECVFLCSCFVVLCCGCVVIVDCCSAVHWIDVVLQLLLAGIAIVLKWPWISVTILLCCAMLCCALLR